MSKQKLFPSERFIVRNNISLDKYRSLNSFCKDNNISVCYKPHLMQIWFSKWGDGANYQIFKCGLSWIEMFCENHASLLGEFKNE